MFYKMFFDKLIIFCSNTRKGEKESRHKITMSPIITAARHNNI